MTEAQQHQLIRLPAVLAMTGLSKTSLYDAIKSGEFPRACNISRRSRAWVFCEVSDWVQNKIDSRVCNE